MQSLQFAYLANVVILTPIALPTVFHLFPTDQGRFVESAGWRVLVGAIWFGILFLSVLGLIHPLRYSPILLLQLIYKTIWLGTYAIPRLTSKNWNSIPWGITASFAVIVAIWPFLIPWPYLLGQS